MASVFVSEFVSETRDLLSRPDLDAVDRIVDIVREARDVGGRLFFCGSGGGAGHASHATCDFRKLAGVETYCVSDNVSELTARVNDDGWDGSYAAWLTTSRIGAGDVLFVFSVGGGDANRGISTNLVAAMECAVARGARVVGVAGRDGGTLGKLADAAVIVPVGNEQNVTAQVEGLQAVVWHMIVTHPKLCSSTPKWESIKT
jgi:D-sedoheptulose 7-phosphate isomerase